jgi:putative ABC transport system substrate-binding protein
MRRRELIARLAGAAAASSVSWPLVAPLLTPLAAYAQRAERVWRIGWLSTASGPGRTTQSFLQGMQERGYVEGKNLAIDYRWSPGKSEQLEQFAAELVRAGVDVIVTVGTPATLAAKAATSTMPIVFVAAGAPIQKGIVDSLARPGGNVTGLALITDDIKSLEILKEIVPGTSRAVFIYDPNTLPGRFGETWLSGARARSRTLKVELQPVILSHPDKAAQVLAALPGRADALLIGGSTTNILARGRICAFAAQRRLPTASNERAFAEAGCLMSYGEDQRDMHRRAATYVDKIFKGAKPADLPVEQPTKFQLVVNLKAATTLGLTVPDTMLARADEVIE